MNDLLEDFLNRYSFVIGDGYVDLALSFTLPLLAEDERSVEYALKVLYVLTGRSEFRNALRDYV